MIGAARCGCPLIPPTIEDAGGPDEGEGEGDVDGCNRIPEPFDDLYTEAGAPIYENCHWAERYATCGAGGCVDDAREQDFVDTILAIASSRGYPPALEFAEVAVTDVEARAAFIVSVDWSKMRFLVHVLANDGGAFEQAAIEDEMPLWLPATMPSIDDIWSAVRACDDDAMPFFCYMSSNVAGYFVGVCGLADLPLWDPDVIGSGMGDVACYPDDLPCCEPEFP